MCLCGPNSRHSLEAAVALKVKGKVPRWGTSAPQPKAYCALTPKEFLLSSLEALHTEQYAAPQLAKEGTM
jgi:hypothetical protein